MKWTISEDEYLKTNLDKTDAELSLILNRNRQAIIRHRINILGVRKKGGQQKKLIAPKECPLCHKIFASKSKYCSRECFKENCKLRIWRNPRIWKCPECGQDDASKKSYKRICIDCLKKKKNHICQKCKTPFKSFKYSQKCQLCRNLRKCEYCKKSYSSEKKIRKYCSLNCKRKGMRKSNRPFPTCAKCGKEFFDSHNRGRQFCSNKCYKRFRQEIWEKNRKGICIVCKKIFQYHKSNDGCYRYRSKYCSEKCKKFLLANKYLASLKKAREKRWGKFYWTDKELKILVQEFRKRDTKHIAKLLPNRSKQTIRVKARRLGLYKT